MVLNEVSLSFLSSLLISSFSPFAPGKGRKEGTMDGALRPRKRGLNTDLIGNPTASSSALLSLLPARHPFTKCLSWTDGQRRGWVGGWASKAGKGGGGRGGKKSWVEGGRRRPEFLLFLLFFGLLLFFARKQQAPPPTKGGESHPRTPEQATNLREGEERHCTHTSAVLYIVGVESRATQRHGSTILLVHIAFSSAHTTAASSRSKKKEH